MRKDLAAIVHKLEPSDVRHCRDAAMILLGWYAALRSDELVALDWSQFGGTAAGGKGVLTAEPYGLQVELLSSKASQDKPVTVFVHNLDAPAVRMWVERWIEHAGILPGEPLWRPIDVRGRILRARLAPAAVTGILRRRIVEHERAKGTLANRAHAIALSYTSHSLRRGYISAAAEAGIPLGEIRARSRHGSDQVLTGYIRTAHDRRAGLSKKLSI